MPTFQVEEHIVAATKHILLALEACTDTNDDFRRAVRVIDSHLSKMVIITRSKGTEFLQIEEQLKLAEAKIVQWKSNPSLIWDAGPMEVNDYLQAVNQILMVIESLEGVILSENSRAREISFQAQCLLQISMLRLEEELCHILIQHKKQIESRYVPIDLPVPVVRYDESFSSIEGEIGEESPRVDRESLANGVDLIDPHVIPGIKSIVQVMSAANYIREFCEAFIGNRREALSEYLLSLEIEQRSIEDVMKLDWDCLNSEIKKWIWAMKIIVKVYLASEKRLCNTILGDYGSSNSICFVEISKDSVLGLLNFGQAVAMTPRTPEKLVCLLNMYELVTDLRLEINSLFSGPEGSLIRTEFQELSQNLVNTLTGTFFKFEQAIASDTSASPVPRGGLHPLTQYVMNYMTLLADYSNTLDALLKDQESGNPNPGNGAEPSVDCTLACQFRSIALTLESNLTEKSKLYKDEALQIIFLINNIHYMVQKVKNSKLRILLGDEWIRRHNGKFQQHATSYVRVTWSSIISMLRDDGRTTWRERCRRFCSAFEEVYKVQTQWRVPDAQLREDLQILTSQRVVLAYRTFLGHNNNNVCDRYVKYTADDLEELFLDLFVGSPRSLRNSRRR